MKNGAQLQLFSIKPASGKKTISSGQNTNSPSVQLSQMASLCRAESFFVSHSKKLLENSFYCNSLTRMITAGNSAQKQSQGWMGSAEHWSGRRCFRACNSPHLAFETLETQEFQLCFAMFSLVPFSMSLFHHNRNVFIVNSLLSEEENWGPLGGKSLFY